MKKIDLRFSVLLIMVLLAGFSRIIVHIDNFTPIAAMALFGGAYFSTKGKAWLLPLLTLFLSDMVIQGVVYESKFGFPLYKGWYWVYAAIALAVLFGKWIIKKVSLKNVVLAALVSSVAHWIITDFGVWLVGCTDLTTGQLYTKDLSGLLKCYYLSIPYMKDFFFGTIFYSGIMFGAFELAQKKIPLLSRPHLA